MTQKTAEYSKGSKFFHWLIALIVIVMLSVTFFFGDLPKDIRPTAYTVHKSFGITVLFLMILRLIWLLKSGKPSLPKSVALWQQRAAHTVHYALYILIISMALSGWLMTMAADRIPYYFGLFPFPLPWVEPDKALAQLMNTTHKTLAWIIIAFVALHIAAALKHYFIDKDDVVQRMLP